MSESGTHVLTNSKLGSEESTDFGLEGRGVQGEKTLAMVLR